MRPEGLSEEQEAIFERLLAEMKAIIEEEEESQADGSPTRESITAEPSPSLLYPIFAWDANQQFPAMHLN